MYYDHNLCKCDKDFNERDKKRNFKYLMCLEINIYLHGTFDNNCPSPKLRNSQVTR